MISLKELSTEADNDQKLENELIRTDDEHYVWMEKRFNSDNMWMWILNLVAYVAVIATYLSLDGQEIIYSMYIPLDILLNFSKAFFYFFSYM